MRPHAWCFAMLVLLAAGAPASLAETATEARLDDPRLRYQERDGNRWEGIRPRRHSVSAPELVSLAIKPEGGFGEPPPEELQLTIPAQHNPFTYGETLVTVRQPAINYWLDQLRLTKDDDYLRFRWPTDRVVGPAGIDPASLALRAEDYYGVLYPVRLTGARTVGSPRYRLGIYAEESLLLLETFRVRRADSGDIVFEPTATRKKAPAYEWIILTWDGTSGGRPVPSGRYLIDFTVSIRDDQGGVVQEVSKPDVPFYHDAALLR